MACYASLRYQSVIRMAALERWLSTYGTGSAEEARGFTQRWNV